MPSKTTDSRNPYIAENGIPKLHYSAFVFMDILGYSDLIVEAEKNNAQGPLLARLHSALAEGRTWLDIARRKRVNRYSGGLKISMC